MSIKTVRKALCAIGVATALTLGSPVSAGAVDPTQTLTIKPDIGMKCILLSCGSWLNSVTFTAKSTQVMKSIRNTSSMTWVWNGSLYMQQEKTVSNSTYNTIVFNPGNKPGGDWNARLSATFSKSGYYMSTATTKRITVYALA